MAIGNVSSTSQVASYQRVQSGQGNGNGTGQRIQKRDGTGSGKQMGKMENTPTEATSTNYSKNSTMQTSAIGSSFDMKI